MVRASLFLSAVAIEPWWTGKSSIQSYRSIDDLTRFHADQNIWADQDKDILSSGWADGVVAPVVKNIGVDTNGPKGGVKALGKISSSFDSIHCWIQIFKLIVLINTHSIGEVLIHHASSSENIILACSNTCSPPIAIKPTWCRCAELRGRAVVNIQKSTSLILSPSCGLSVRIVDWSIPTCAVEES